MSEIIGHIFVIAFFWFMFYWVFGGVLFAVVSIMNVSKFRRARFSCLFTTASLICGFGAAYSGAMAAKESIDACLVESNDMFGRLASVVACGVFEQMVAGVFWFFILLCLSALAYILSRAGNQSWIDSHEGTDDDHFDLLEF